MYKKCFISNCGNSTEDGSKKIFLSVPNDERRMKWFQAAEIRYVPKGSAVYCCEDHFNLEQDTENWIEYKTIGTKLRVMKNVVPHKYITIPKTMALQQSSQLSSSSRKRKLSVMADLQKQREQAKKKFTFEEASLEAPISVGTGTHTKENVIASPSGLFQVNETFTTSSEDLYYNPPQLEPVITFSNKAVQVCRRPFHRSIKIGTEMVKIRSIGTMTENIPVEKPVFRKPKPIIKKQEDESPSSSSTSLESSETAFSLITSGGASSASKGSNGQSSSTNTSDVLYQKAHIRIIETKSRFYLGIPKDSYFIIKKTTKVLNMQYEHILICLKKIRLDDTNSRLADDFGVSPSYIGKIFNKSIPLLAAAFQKFVYWPEAKLIEALLPIPFRYWYRKVQSIVDCLEIEIQIPSNPLKQSLTWSEYKKCNTVKYMISATPHGFINFISRGYGGRTTDKEIFQSCGYIDVLTENSEILVDRGFKNVAHLLTAKNCKIRRPPFVSTSTTLSKAEVQETKRIAALRIHIERTIRRLREFYILGRHACISSNYLHLYDCIIKIACGIVNLQSDLIKY